MRSRLVGSAVLCGIVLSGPEAAAQYARTSFLDQCSTGSLRTCASFQAETYRYRTEAGWRTQIYLRVRNLYAVLADGRTTGSTLTRLGVLTPRDMMDPRFENGLTTPMNRGGSNTVFAEAGAVEAGDPARLWKAASSDPSGGRADFGVATKSKLGGITDCLAPTPPGAQHGPEYYSTCTEGAPGGWTTFAFTTASDVKPWEMQIAWGVVSEPGSSGSGSAHGFVAGKTCEGCGVTDVVPEPATMILLGSGLAGLGGRALVRRRRRTGDDVDTV